MEQKNFWLSATKITLLALIGTLCFGVLYSLFFSLESFKELNNIFNTVVVAVVSFYFGQKNTPAK